MPRLRRRGPLQVWEDRHRSWKRYASPERCEVRMERFTGPDVCSPADGPLGSTTGLTCTTCRSGPLGPLPVYPRSRTSRHPRGYSAESSKRYLIENLRKLLRLKRDRSSARGMRYSTRHHERERLRRTPVRPRDCARPAGGTVRRVTGGTFSFEAVGAPRRLLVTCPCGATIDVSPPARCTCVCGQEWVFTVAACPDCRATPGWYVGLHERSPCPTCRGGELVKFR